MRRREAVPAVAGPVGSQSVGEPVAARKRRRRRRPRGVRSRHSRWRPTSTGVSGVARRLVPVVGRVLQPDLPPHADRAQVVVAEEARVAVVAAVVRDGSIAATMILATASEL